MSAIEVELYALSDMNTALRKLKAGGEEALEQADLICTKKQT